MGRRLASRAGGHFVRTFEVQGTDRKGKVTDSIGTVKISAPVKDARVFATLLEHGHIVSAKQRSAYTFVRFDDSIIVLFRGVPEYILKRHYA